MQSDDEPPAENNGSVIPIQGKSESSIPMFTSICANSITDIPLHIRYPTLSLALIAVLSTLSTRKPSIKTTNRAPIKPSSSPATYKIISF